MFVNIPSRIVEIQQYFVAIYPYFLNLFSHLMCACFKYEFMYLDVILKSFFRLNVRFWPSLFFAFSSIFKSSLSIKF
jgi:hypothetical protein